MKFIKPNDLSIIENEDEFILRKGFLHMNEVIIDKKESAVDFNDKMFDFIKNEEVVISEEENAYEDFMQLIKFDLINMETSKDNILIFTSKNYLEKARKILNDSIIVKNITSLITRKEINILVKNKKVLSLQELVTSKSKKMSNYDHLYYVENFAHFSRLRAFNILMKKLNKENTIGIIDYNNIYLTGIKHGYTGCYECLEKHIISKFKGKIEDYTASFDNINTDVAGEKNLIFSLIQKDIDNYMRYGGSSLEGNVMHFYLPSFEYNFDMNRRTSFCPTCATMNNIVFEEQNIRSINILKEMEQNV